MAKPKESPTQWMPPEGKSQSEYTLLEFWSVAHSKIAEMRRFERPTETISDYTASIKNIEEALSQKPALAMNPFDLWNAIVSVRYQTRGAAAGTLYKPSTFKKRHSILKDIYQYIEESGIGINPISRMLWSAVEQSSDFSLSAVELQKNMRNEYEGRILPRYLSPAQERTLMKNILDNVENDGRWIGLALLFWCGLRPSEARGLCWHHRRVFIDHPDRNYLHAVITMDRNGNPKKRMKTRNSIRSIPEHVELKYVLDRRVDFLKKQGYDDISKVPLICYKDKITQGCSTTELASFIKKEVGELFRPEFLKESALAFYCEIDLTKETGSATSRRNLSNISADAELSARLFRRNYATKSCSTSLTEADVRYSMGHDETSIKFPYSEALLYQRALKLDEWVVLADLHIATVEDFDGE